MALGVIGRSFRDVVILSAMGLASFWTLNHRDTVYHALGIEMPSPQLASTDARDGSKRKHRATGFERSVTLQARDDGHFYGRVEVNGRLLDVMVDTGASGVGLTYEDARAAGIQLTDADFKYGSQTANGVARIAIVTLDRVQLGDVEVRNVKASVAEPGHLHVTLLGMSFLSRLSRFEMKGRELVLVE